MEVKDMTVTYGGIHDTDKGTLLLKFKAPESEAGLFARMYLFTKKQVFVFAKWQSQNEKGEPLERDEQLGVFYYAGKNEDEEGECTIRLRGDVNSLDDTIMGQMKRDCVKGLTGEAKTLLLTVWDSEEALKNQTVAP